MNTIYNVIFTLHLITGVLLIGGLLWAAWIWINQFPQDWDDSELESWEDDDND